MRCPSRRPVVVAILVGVAAIVAAPAELAAAPDAGAVVDNVRVGVSAELAATFRELGAVFTQLGGVTVTVTTAPPAELLDKAAKGAQLDLLGAGSDSFAGSQPSVCNAASLRRYARGRLAIWTRSGAPPTAHDLVEPRWKKIAVAEPNLAAYGRAANQALESAGVLPEVMSRLVYRADSADALALARDGRADAALVALSLVVDDKGKGRYSIVDPELYAPIDESLILCGTDPARLAAARALAAFVGSPRAAQILKKHALDPQSH